MFETLLFAFTSAAALGCYAIGVVTGKWVTESKFAVPEARPEPRHRRR